MTRFLLNATFSIETGELLSHDGEFFDDAAILFDRTIASNAGNNAKQAGGVVGQAQANANIDRSSVIPGLQRDAQTPIGYNAGQLNNMLVSSQEGAGGANATVGGEGRLAALRSRTAGGYAPALDEAQRQKGRTLATNALDIQNQNARLGLERQQQARNQLLGLYGTDTSNMLHAMGVQNEDLNTQLAAKRQGWEQELEQGLDTVSGMGGKAAGAYGSLGLAS
jgi:hypothetical protein